MIHFLVFFTTVISLVASLAGAGIEPEVQANQKTPRLSAGCMTKAPVPSGESAELSLKAGGLERTYRLHLPSNYDPSSPVPLVLVIHGYTGNALETETKNTNFSRHGDKNGYAVAYPQGTGFEVNGKMVTSWNDLACNSSPGPEGSICTKTADDYPTPPECGEPRECDWCTCYDDVEYIAGLLDDVEKSVCIDLDRVYATGISNGGMFVHRLGCDLTDRFAAIAPVAGTLAVGFNCAPDGSPKTSMMNFYGTRDRVVPFDGTPSSDGFLYTPSAQVMAAWAGKDSQQCNSENSPYPTSRDGVQGLSCVERADCGSGAEVVDCGWNGDHDWPREGEDHFGVDVIWEFFEKNGR